LFLKKTFGCLNYKSKSWSNEREDYQLKVLSQALKEMLKSESLLEKHAEDGTHSALEQ